MNINIRKLGTGASEWILESKLKIMKDIRHFLEIYSFGFCLNIWRSYSLSYLSSLNTFADLNSTKNLFASLKFSQSLGILNLDF
jgi:hypothetical protein